MIKRSRLISFVFCILAFVSCKKLEKAKRSSLEGKKTEYLIAQMHSNEVTFDTFSAKSNVSLFQENKKTSFKTVLRIKKDSAIWVSITPLLGIEMARVLITRDTVKVLNRLAKEYFIGDYNYINKRFNVEFEYEVLQAILLGNAIAFEQDEKVKFATDKEDYYLGNMKKRKARKADDKPEKIERKEDEILSLWINQSTFKIAKFLISDLTADKFILGEYTSHIELDNQLVPNKLKFEIQSNTPAKLEMEYSKIALNDPLKFSFKVSSKYERVSF